MAWASVIVSIAAALACLVAAILTAKRVGGVAPWLIAAVAAIDALLIAMFRIFFFSVRGGAPSFEEIRDTLGVLELIDGVATYIMGFMVLIALASLMPRVRR